jgi:hypothetical protein
LPTWLAAPNAIGTLRAEPRARAHVEQILTREDIALRERTLWRMLYETPARQISLTSQVAREVERISNRWPAVYK